MAASGSRSWGDWLSFGGPAGLFQWPRQKTGNGRPGDWPSREPGTEAWLAPGRARGWPCRAAEFLSVPHRWTPTGRCAAAPPCKAGTMASQVAWSAMPVTGKPMNRWNSDTARRVVGPKIPSGMTIGRRGSAMEMTRSMGLEASDALILERFFRSHRTTSRTTGSGCPEPDLFGNWVSAVFSGVRPCRGQRRDRCPALDGEILSGPEGGIFNAGILIVDGLPGSVVHFRSRKAEKRWAASTAARVPLP